jgi:hypothetical protein
MIASWAHHQHLNLDGMLKVHDHMGAGVHRLAGEV